MSEGGFLYYIQLLPSVKQSDFDTGRQKAYYLILCVGESPSPTKKEDALRILIFGEKLQLEAPSLKLEYAARRVDLTFHKNVVAVDAYVRRHPVDACIVTADHHGTEVAQRLREYEGVMVSHKLADPADLKATIEKILASRPKRAA